MPLTTDSQVREVFDYRTIAVVGASTTPSKDAHQIPKYLHDQGYDVIPVNPNAESVFGIEAYDSLTEIPREVDVVDVFRPSDEVAGIVDEAIDRGDVKVVWLQLGIHDDEAVARAEAAGIEVVQDRCMMPEHRRLVA